jgi:hypothetical protein
VAEQANELTALPAVLRQLALAGCLVASTRWAATVIAQQILDQERTTCWR